MTKSIYSLLLATLKRGVIRSVKIKNEFLRINDLTSANNYDKIKHSLDFRKKRDAYAVYYKRN